MADYTLTRTGADIDNIGQFITGDTSLSTISNGIATNLCSVTLTKGVWVITGTIRISTGNEAFRVSGSLTTLSGTIVTTGHGGYFQLPATTSMVGFGMNLTRIMNVTTSSTTVYLVCAQQGTSEKTVYDGRIGAVRIK